MEGTWTVTVTVEGRPYRWATVAGTFGGDVYRGGLGDLALARGDEPSITVADPGTNWPSLADYLDGSPCVVYFWTSADAGEVYAYGEVVEVSTGSALDEVSWGVALTTGPLLGRAMPDVLAVVDATTWPVDSPGYDGGTAGVYPVILGLPGYRGTSGVTSYQCVPVPVAQWKSGQHATSYVIVSEDPDQPITSIRLRNDTTAATDLEDVVVTTDLRGRRVRAAHFANSSSPFPVDATEVFYAGFRPNGGGGPRTAYDVIRYVLRRWGPESVDWARLPEIADALTPYLVDTWIDESVPDPWAWLESVLLPDLPVAVRTSDRGRYLVHRRYRSDPGRYVGAIEVDPGQRVGPRRRDGVALNEFLARYRRDRDGDWLARTILTGRPEEIAPGVNVDDVATCGLCIASAARYGSRRAEAWDIDWTWDTGTVQRLLLDRAERSANPATIVEYEIDDLEEGDEFALTDEAMGFDGRTAIVDAPPVRTATTSTVRLRLPS